MSKVEEIRELKNQLHEMMAQETQITRISLQASLVEASRHLNRAAEVMNEALGVGLVPIRFQVEQFKKARITIAECLESLGSDKQ